jgi:hypothetical protein
VTCTHCHNKLSQSVKVLIDCRAAHRHFFSCCLQHKFALEFKFLNGFIRYSIRKSSIAAALLEREISQQQREN